MTASKSATCTVTKPCRCGSEGQLQQARRRQQREGGRRDGERHAPASAHGPSTAFKAALVPTATKPGVSTTPCGVCSLPTRAPDLEDLQHTCERQRGTIKQRVSTDLCVASEVMLPG